MKEIEKDKSALPTSAPDSVDGRSDRGIMATKVSNTSAVYDVFISYAHKTPKEANKMYENLLDLEPELKVFLDRSVLRTGGCHGGVVLFMSCAHTVYGA